VEAHACAVVTILEGGFEIRVTLAVETSSYKQEKPVSKHDVPTKRKRRPKSDKRVDYTARTMAAIRQHSEAAKLNLRA
jgi:hypothetical protein